MKLPIKTLRTLIISMILLFSVEAHAQLPTLVNPANNSVCVTMAPRLTWDLIPNYTYYRVVVATDSNFTAPVVDVDSTIYSFIDLNLTGYGTDYYWKVVAYSDNDTTTMDSDFRKFTTRQAAITLQEPQDSLKCVPISVQLVWDAAPDAIHYKLEYSTTPDFSMGTFVIDSIADTNYTISGLNFGTYYWWRVSGQFEGCLGNWSDSRTFLTKAAPVMLATPANNSKGLPLFANGFPFNLELKWHPVENVHHYEVMLSDSAHFPNPIFDKEMTSDTSFAVIDTLKQIYNKQYFWRVRAIISDDVTIRDGGNLCQLDWSATYTFKTPYKNVMLSEPINNAECVDFEHPFTWHPVEGASRYTIILSSKNDFSDTLHIAHNLSDTLVAFPLDKDLAVYYWRVRAEDLNNIGYWSDAFKFKTTITPTTAIHPENNAVGIPETVHYVWNGGNANHLYRFQVSETDDFSVIVLDTANLTENTLTFVHNKFNKYYYWRVQTFAEGCTSDWSETYMFKTKLAAPVLTSPIDSTESLEHTPTFKWLPVTAALNYEFMLDTNINFKSAITRIGVPANELRLIVPLLEDTRYFWRVRAVNQEGISQWSEVFTFVTGFMLPTTPILITPANESVMHPIQDLELVWASVPKAESYHLQVTKLIEFSNLIVDTLDLTDTTFMLSDLDHYVTYQFRVRANNQAGFSEWSLPFSFRTINTAPTTPVDLVAPAHTSINQPIGIRLSWLATHRAEGYHLQVATDEMFTNIIHEEKSIYVLYSNVYNLNYDTRYFWRVKSWNEAGEGPWSEVRYFNTLNLVSVNDELTAKYNLNVFPNPVANDLVLQLDVAEMSDVTFKLFNTNGVEVVAPISKSFHAGANALNINVSSLASGVYIWSLNIAGETVSGRITVSR